MGFDNVVGRLINGDNVVSQLINDIQFANRFKAKINKDNIFKTENESSLHIKSINFPNSTSEIKDRNTNGVPIKLSGVRTIDTLNITTYDSEGGEIRNKFDKWQNEIYDLRTGKRGYYNDYIGSILLYIYGFDNNISNIVLFNEVWPTNVGDITYSRDSTNTLIEFPVAFAFKNFKIV